ncbi:MAG: DUF6265 family protein [Terricaulis sp.]
MRLLIFLAALLSATSAFAEEPDSFTWMRGCWRTEAPREAESGATFTEVWIAPPGPTMFGYAYHEGEGQFQGWEQMRIERADGGAYFVAMPNGDPPVRFRWDGAGDFNGRGQVAEFVNPEHDYPQRVRYARANDQLTATISRIDGSGPMTFAYRRIRCPAHLRP